MSLFRSAATIGGYTLISRILGFVRDMCIASFIGANYVTDAFFVAFKLPNFMRRLFAEGAFNSAFVPIYAGTLAAEGRKNAQNFASEAMSVLIVALITVVVLMEIFAPQMMIFLAPGFEKDPGKFELTVALTRITFPYIFFISLVSLYGGILNSVERFAAVAATPILMNICFILSTVFWRETHGFNLAWGVFAAGIAQYGWLAYACKRCGLLPKLQFPRLTVGVRQLFRLIGPAALGAGVAQINLMVDMMIASSVPQGVSYLYYADRISELPLAVIGIGVGTALLPMLSKQLREGKREEAQHTQNRAIEMVMLLSLPAAAALIVIAKPIIATLFEHGAFRVGDTLKTFPTLMAFGLGLPAFVLVKVLAPGFYANQDTKTPFQIATICVVINLILNLALVRPMAQTGMALATTIASWVNVGLMVWILHKRGLFVSDDLLRRRLVRIALASLGMAVFLLGGSFLLSNLFSASLVLRGVALFALIISAMAVYGVLAFVLKAFNIAQVKSLLARRKPD